MNQKIDSGKTLIPWPILVDHYKHDRERRERKAIREVLRSRWLSLNDREQEIAKLAVKGMMNKQIAFQLKISEVTVKVHRGHAMKKIQANSHTEFVRLIESIEKQA